MGCRKGRMTEVQDEWTDELLGNRLTSVVFAQDARNGRARIRNVKGAV